MALEGALDGWQGGLLETGGAEPDAVEVTFVVLGAAIFVPADLLNFEEAEPLERLARGRGSEATNICDYRAGVSGSKFVSCCS